MMAAARANIPPQRGDEEQLFRRYNKSLRRVTQLAVGTSPDIVDDACAFAWMKLISNQPERDKVFSWLKVVARNEAFRLDRLQRGVAQMETAIEAWPALEPAARRARIDTAQRMLEVRERLEQLPERQRELVFLNAAGWRYKDLAERTGVGVPRIGQLIARAASKLSEMDMREQEATSPRAAKLRDLEREPPRYVVAAIGRMPSARRRSVSDEIRREWRRLALAIDEFRDAYQVTHPIAALGTHAGLPGRDELAKRIAVFREARGLSRGVERGGGELER